MTKYGGFGEKDAAAAVMKEIEHHLEPRPFIVLPVLDKSAIADQSVLTLLWKLAYEALTGADSVTFVGYSLPPTDIAARYLFSEGLAKVDCSRIEVVNFASDEATRALLKETYRSLGLGLDDSQFNFNGALDWSQKLLSEKTGHADVPTAN